MNSNQKIKSHNELKLISNYEKYNAAFVILFLAGIILFFLNWKFGLLIVLTSIALIIYASKKYPEEHKKFIEQNTETIKKYPIIHVEGIKNQDTNQKCKIAASEDKIYFYSDKAKLVEIFENKEIKNVAILEKVKKLKEKSPLIRAAVGGLILGPVGAVIGGISGAVPSYDDSKMYYMELQTQSKNIIFAINGKNAKILKEKILK